MVQSYSPGCVNVRFRSSTMYCALCVRPSLSPDLSPCTGCYKLPVVDIVRWGTRRPMSPELTPSAMADCYESVGESFDDDVLSTWPRAVDSVQ